MSKLLVKLRESHPELPRDARTLLKTNAVVKSEEQYFTLGFVNGLKGCGLWDKLSESSQYDHSLTLSFNIDGLNLFKSSNTQLWPILCRIIEYPECNPFVVRLFCGTSKPSCIDEYLKPFVTELNEILLNGLNYGKMHVTFSILNFICDAPAKAFIKQSKLCTGYSGCDKGSQHGVYFNKVIYPEIDLSLRTDVTFRSQLDEDHHCGLSPLLNLPIDMVSCFPVDPMHQVYLGVTRRCCLAWLRGSTKVRLQHSTVSLLSQLLAGTAKLYPSEINRKPRSIDAIDRWKASEFYIFLVYSAPLHLQQILSDKVYSHFMLLSVGIFILCHPVLHKTHLDYCNKLLVCFVEQFKLYYGLENMVYNVHSLLHLTSDVQRFGCLHQFSAFPFENYLGMLKKLLRAKKFPLQEISNRLIEQCELKRTQKKKQHATLMRQHDNGPCPVEMIVQSQFHCAVVKNFRITTEMRNSCFTDINERVYMCINIVKCDDVNYAYCKELLPSEDLFQYPCKSSLIGIYLMSKSADFTIIPLMNISSKNVIFPHKNNYIIFPLLHTLA